MIDSQRGEKRRVGYNHIISNQRELVEQLFYSKNNHFILLDLTGFALQEQPEDDSMVAISRTWYNGSYSVAPKPIKSLELRYTVILLLRNVCMSYSLKFCLSVLGIYSGLFKLICAI